MTGAIEEVQKEAGRIEEDSLYSSKGHFIAAGRWRKVHFIIGVPTAIIAAITAGTILAEESIASIVLVLLVTALSAVTTFLNPNEKASLHQSAGTNFSSLKNEARIFRNVELTQLNEGSAHKRLKELDIKRSELNSSSPPVPTWAYKKAKKGIEEGEAEYSAQS